MAEGEPPPGAQQAPTSASAHGAGAESTTRPAIPPGGEGGPRDRLARLALDAALGVEGVARPAGPAGGLPALGPLFPGVNAVADGPHRYGVVLHLVAELVPLIPLGEAVREAVVDAAAHEGIGSELGSVDVRFEAVEGPR